MQVVTRISSCVMASSPHLPQGPSPTPPWAPLRHPIQKHRSVCARTCRHARSALMRIGNCCAAPAGSPASKKRRRAAATSSRSSGRAARMPFTADSHSPAQSENPGTSATVSASAPDRRHQCVCLFGAPHSTAVLLRGPLEVQAMAARLTRRSERFYKGGLAVGHRWTAIARQTSGYSESIQHTHSHRPTPPYPCTSSHRRSTSCHRARSMLRSAVLRSIASRVCASEQRPSSCRIMSPSIDRKQPQTRARQPSSGE